MHQLVREFLEALISPFLWMKVKAIEAFFNLKIKRLYYNEVFFKRVDRTYLKAYKTINPYAISLSYLKSIKAEDVYSYGETPLFVFHTMFSNWLIDSQAVFVDLGCGGGRGLFFGACFFDAKFVGIERIPLFVKKAKTLAKTFSIRHLSFLEGDYFKLNLSFGDVFYYFCLRSSDSEIKKMCEKFIKECKTTSKWITVSFPLSDLDERFIVLGKQEGVFVWGRTFLYLNGIK